MEPFAMPAFSITADCIRRAFIGSGKRHLILTGSRGSGKSTLLRALSSESMPGMITRVVPGEAVYVRQNSTGQEVMVGKFNPFLLGLENRMRPCAEAFRDFGLPALERFASGPNEWAAIDEIGYLETGCPEYCDALFRLMDRKHLIAVVRKQELPFLKKLLNRGDVFIVDLDKPFGSVNCIIMASGLGRRFGGNKLMEDFHGQPMVCRILDATEGIFTKRVVVTRYRKIEAICRQRGIPTVVHDLANRSDTIRLGVEAVGREAGCMFCPGDQPLLSADTIRALAICGANDPCGIWRPEHNGVPGAPVLFPRWSLRELTALQAGYGGGSITKKYPDHVHTVSVASPCELQDADSPEDLEHLRQISE